MATATATAAAQVKPDALVTLRQLVNRGTARTFVDGKFWDVHVSQVPAERRKS